MNASELLLKAADELESRDWLQGRLFELNGNDDVTGLCAIGALCLADDGQGPQNFSWEHLNKVFYSAAIRCLAKHLNLRDGEDIICWNNTESQTKEAVIAGLREAGKGGCS